MKFDTEGARKAGYSDTEIADHLAQSAKFDGAQARKAGYSDDDIIKHLTVAPAQTIGQSIKQGAGNLLAGAVRGAGSIGATLLAPVDAAARALNKGNPVSVGGIEIAGHDRRAGMDAGLQSMGAEPDSGLFKTGKISTEVLGTMGVGGGLANVAGRAVPAIANAPILTALRTSGMTTGLNPVTMGQKAADLGARALAGGVSGGASAGLVTPGDAGAGAAVGAALPPTLKAAGAVGRGIVGTVKHGLGMYTGIGAESISQAVKAGKAGNADFLNNMRGDVPLTDVLDRAKQGLEAMRVAKSAQYRSGMIPIGKDQTVLTFQGIDQALADAAAITGYKGQVKNQSAAGAVGKMRQIVEEWRALDPQQFHTPEGLDALKQKLGGVLESIPFEEKTARLAAGRVYSATKASIDQQAPTYAKVMGDYSAQSQQITEIEKALSLGSKASQDTAMRKLQSLMRNNVQTNYGGRLKNASDLEQLGGVELLPSIAGQAMNSWTPRSLAGQIGGGATSLMALSNPAMAALLPLQSPRVVGELAYGAGKVGRLSDLAGPQANQLIYRAAPAATAPTMRDYFK